MSINDSYNIFHKRLGTVRTVLKSSNLFGVEMYRPARVALTCVIENELDKPNTCSIHDSTRVLWHRYVIHATLHRVCPARFARCIVGQYTSSETPRSSISYTCYWHFTRVAAASFEYLTVNDIWRRIQSLRSKSRALVK